MKINCKTCNDVGFLQVCMGDIECGKEKVVYNYLMDIQCPFCSFNAKFTYTELFLYAYGYKNGWEKRCELENKNNEILPIYYFGQYPVEGGENRKAERIAINKRLKELKEENNEPNKQ